MGNNAAIQERYDELYETMAMSRDARKMRIFGEAEKWGFAQVLSMNPSIAEKWLKKIEAVDWNNYLTDEEANEIAEGLVNQDGRTGPMWNRSQVEGAIRGFGGDMEFMPYYNDDAMYVMMNTIASDHLDTLREYVPEQDMTRVVYKLSVEKLKDKDRPQFIREYFGLD